MTRLNLHQSGGSFQCYNNVTLTQIVYKCHMNALSRFIHKKKKLMKHDKN